VVLTSSGPAPRVINDPTDGVEEVLPRRVDLIAYRDACAASLDGATPVSTRLNSPRNDPAILECAPAAR
jgi:hypothetical protein